MEREKEEHKRNGEKKENLKGVVHVIKFHSIFS